VSFRLQWSEHARDSLRDIRDHYEERRTGSGFKVARAIIQSIERLRALPYLAPRHPRLGDPTTRRKVSGRHVVIYRVREEIEEVQILSVRHQRQREPTLEELEQD